MFWKKKGRKALPDSTEKNELTSDATEIFRTKLAKIELRRAILNWRDEQVEKIELRLGNELDTLYKELDEITENMSLRKLFVARKYIEEHCEPIYKNWIAREKKYISNAAQRDLWTLLEDAAVEYGKYSAEFVHERGSGGLFGDIAMGASTVGAAALLFPASSALTVKFSLVVLPFVSSSPLLGIFGAPTIMVPGVGLIFIGALVIFGGQKLAQAKSKEISKLQAALKVEIRKNVMGYGEEENSIRQWLQASMDETAHRIISEIDRW